MAPPARMKRALTFSGVNPTCGPLMATAAQMSLLISLLCTDVHFFLCKNISKEVWLVVPWC